MRERRRGWFEPSDGGRFLAADFASARWRLDRRNRFQQRSRVGAGPDFTGSVFAVDDTTMFVSPCEPTASLPHTGALAADAAIEELDLGPLDSELVEELAIALL